MNEDEINELLHEYFSHIDDGGDMVFNEGSVKAIIEIVQSKCK